MRAGEEKLRGRSSTAGDDRDVFTQISDPVCDPDGSLMSARLRRR
jgi:hypothetical protein